MSHDWITLHRLRFDSFRGKDEIWIPHLPGAAFTRFCIGFRLSNEDDLLPRGDEWGVMGVYSTQDAARAVFDDPRTALPATSETLEAWHGLAIPLSHRGTVTWRGHEETDSALRCGRADGPLIVVTSAGYSTPPSVARARRFAKGVQDVLDFFDQAPGNLGRSAFNGGTVDVRDGFTLSFWTNPSRMIAAAYKDGVHKALLDSHATEPMFDYSSFSRLALQQSQGMWDGIEISV